MPYRVCVIHLTRRYRLLYAAILVLFLAACGGGGQDDAAPAAPSAPATPSETGRRTVVLEPGDNTITLPDYYSPEEIPGLPDYIEECHRLNRDFEEANIAYNATEHMRRRDAQTIEAAVTLRTEVPPQKILESEEAVGSRVRVSCVVEAELRASEAEFDIQEQGWQSRSLLTSPTARWTWSVTPKQGGNHELVLAVRPIIALEDEFNNPLPRSHFEASTEIYRITAEVSVPPDQWLAEGLDRTASLLTSMQGVVVALTALVGAIIALRFTVKRRRAESLPNNHTRS